MPLSFDACFSYGRHCRGVRAGAEGVKEVFQKSGYFFFKMKNFWEARFFQAKNFWSQKILKSKKIWIFEKWDLENFRRVKNGGISGLIFQVLAGVMEGEEAQFEGVKVVLMEALEVPKRGGI